LQQQQTEREREREREGGRENKNVLEQAEIEVGKRIHTGFSIAC